MATARPRPTVIVPPFRPATVTQRAFLFLSAESSAGAIPVYPVRGVETPHGGVAESNSALRWVEEES